MDDLTTLAPFLIAINRVAHDAAAYSDDDTRLDRHFKTVVHEEVSKIQPQLSTRPKKLHVLHIPTGSAAIRRKAIPLEELADIEPATPIRPFQIHAPQPDEMIHGWHGRIRAINCLPEKTNIEQEIAKAARQKNALLAPDADAIQYAASLLEIPREELIESHTLTPFFDALEGLKLNKPGTKSARHKHDYDRRAPLRLEGHHPRFCAKCAEDDLERKRLCFSYWRRSHQLPGMLWCQEHGTPLSLAKSRAAFTICPHQVTDSLVNENISLLTSEQAETVKRYAYLVAEILNQAPAIDSRAASATLGQWAKAQNLRTTKVGKRSTVSSIIFSVMPNWWLTENFPRTRWSKNTWHQTVDGACSPRTGHFSSSTLCLLAAVLCDNVEEAKKILWPRQTSKAKQLGTDFWASKAVLNLYIANKGIVNGIGEALNLPNGSAAFGLTRQGLPGLGNTSSATLDAIQAFLNGESSLENISCQYNVPIRELENLLRQGCARLKYALKTMAKQADASDFSQRHTSKKQRFRSVA